MRKLSFCRLENQTGHEAGRMLLAQSYRELTGKEPPPVVIAPGGKPYFENSPWHFSISHTRKHAFCVLADSPVGIDAEEKDRSVRLALAEKILSPGEKLHFQTADDPRLALLRLWVLKEADAKRTGLGLRGYPNQTDFSPEDPRITEIDGCLVAVIEGE